MKLSRLHNRFRWAAEVGPIGLSPFTRLPNEVAWVSLSAAQMKQPTDSRIGRESLSSIQVNRNDTTITFLPTLFVVLVSSNMGWLVHKSLFQLVCFLSTTLDRLVAHMPYNRSQICKGNGKTENRLLLFLRGQQTLWWTHLCQSCEPQVHTECPLMEKNNASLFWAWYSSPSSRRKTTHFLLAFDMFRTVWQLKFRFYFLS